MELRTKGLLCSSAAVNRSWKGRQQLPLDGRTFTRIRARGHKNRHTGTDSSVRIFCCLPQSHTYTETHLLCCAFWATNESEGEGRRQRERERDAGLLSVSHGQADCPQASVHHLPPTHPTTSTASSHSSMLHRTGHKNMHTRRDKHSFCMQSKRRNAQTDIRTDARHPDNALLLHTNAQPQFMQHLHNQRDQFYSCSRTSFVKNYTEFSPRALKPQPALSASLQVIWD